MERQVIINYASEIGIPVIDSEEPQYENNQSTAVRIGAATLMGIVTSCRNLRTRGYPHEDLKREYNEVETRLKEIEGKLRKPSLFSDREDLLEEQLIYTNFRNFLEERLGEQQRLSA